MKKGLQKIFSEIPDRYEIINHLLTFGLDIYWRKKSAKLVTGEKIGLLLDICTGTGEMAINISKFAGNDLKIIALDFSLPMIKKAKTKNVPLSFVISDALKLPFVDGTFDVVAISFATRNINSMPGALHSFFVEVKRILKNNGKFFNLETTQPENKLLKFLFHSYAKVIVKRAGSIISGCETAYKYLSSTIPTFYNANELKEILYDAGFSKVTWKIFFPGIVALHIAEK